MTLGDASDGHERWRGELRARRELRQRLRQRLQEAVAECPVAHALVLAATDWRDAGCGMSVPLPRLRAQAAHRLARLGSDSEVSDQEVEQALEWAMSEPALLHREKGRGGQPGYRVSGDLWPRLNHHRLDDVPDEAVLALATPLEAVGLGVRAMFLRGESDRVLATRSWRQAVDSADEDAAPLAAGYLADLARDDGNVAAARAAYVRVVESGHFDAAPRAMLDLAQLELDRGAEDAARPLLQAAVASGHACVVAPAAGSLASLCLRADDPAGAIEAFRLAADADDPLHSPHYGLLLGRMLAVQGDLAGARDAFQQVIDSEHPLHWAEAVAELGLMLAQHGDVAGGRHVLTQAAAADDPLAAPELVLAMAEIHLIAHEIGEAEALLVRLRAYPLGLELKVEAQVDFLAAWVEAARGNESAASQLFTSLFNGDDRERREWARVFALSFTQHLRGPEIFAMPGAEVLLRFLIDSEDRDVAAWSAYSLGRLTQQQCRWSESREAYRRAAGLDPAVFGARVDLRLADILAEEGEIVRAVDGYLATVEAGPAELTVEAIAAIGRLSGAVGPAQTKVLKRLRDACWQRVRADGTHTADVAFALGRIELDVAGNPYGAVDAWEVAATHADEARRPYAWYNLGVAYAQRDAPLSAALSFQRALDDGSPSIAPLAALGLGRQAELHHDVPAAFAAYRRAFDFALEAADAAHPAVWVEAAYALGRLLHSGQPDDAEIAYHGVIEAVSALDATAPGIVGAAYAHLGRLYAEQGNGELAERVWRQGDQHPDRDVAAAFAAERKFIGRIRDPR